MIERRVRLQAVTAEACVSVLGGGKAVVVLQAECLARFVGHTLRVFLRHAHKSERVGLIRTAEIRV